MEVRILLGPLAARPGFEPGISAPKADVLPLHHRAISRAAQPTMAWGGRFTFILRGVAEMRQGGQAQRAQLGGRQCDALASS